MATIPQVIDQSNYAAERSAAQTETPFATWRRTLARMNTDEIAQMVVDMEQRHIGDLGIVGKALADAEIERAELEQGCADLASRAQTAEERLFTALSLTTSDVYLLENVLKRLNTEQQTHDTTKRLLVQLQAEADSLRNRLTLVAETHVSDLAIMGDAYDALSVAHTEAIDILGRVAHCLVEQLPIGPALTKQIMTIITKDTTP